MTNYISFLTSLDNDCVMTEDADGRWVQRFCLFFYISIGYGKLWEYAGLK